MAYSLIVRSKVRIDLQGIQDYIAKEDQVAALEMINRIEASILTLTEYPERFETYGGEYRRMLVGAYSVFYTIEPFVSVTILSIRHNRRLELSPIDLV